MLADFWFLTLLALLIEAAVGYPQWVWRAIGHPVSWVGRIIGWTDRRFNDVGNSRESRRVAGAIATCATLLLVAIIVWNVESLLFTSLPGLLLLAVLASSLLAQRSLHTHVRDVADALDQNLPAGREAVGRIVGRDVAALDAPAVARAAIESLAENFSDGVVAPVAWMAVSGLTGAALYKTINTADSMIGHRDDRYEDFGKFAARLDDLVNWPAARLAGALIVAAAGLKGGAFAGRAWDTMRRDARRHRSPNAGWPEAAMAGALGLRLAGPRVYHGVEIRDAFMGSGRADLGPADIRAALAVYRRACVLLWLMLALPLTLLL